MSLNSIDVQAIRGKPWQNGFRPIAVYSHDAVDWANRPVQNAGKRPKGDDWGNRARLIPPASPHTLRSLPCCNSGSILVYRLNNRVY